jgi:hypothetical protein
MHLSCHSRQLFLPPQVERIGLGFLLYDNEENSNL